MTIFCLLTLKAIIAELSEGTSRLPKIIISVLQSFRVEPRFLCIAELKSTFDKILDQKSC